MFIDHQQTRIARWTRLFVAGSLGLLVAFLVTERIMLPTLGGLAQFPQFSSLMRVAFLAKVLSPLFSFFLAGGWVWILQVAGEWVISWKDWAAFRSTMPQRLTRLRKSTTSAISFAQKGPTVGRKECMRQIATLPLFQLDLTNPWQHAHLPMTPLSLTNPAWRKIVNPQGNERKGLEEEEEHAEERISRTPTASSIPLQGFGSSSQERETHEQKKATHLGRTGGSISLHRPGEPAETIKPVTLTLLKHVRVWVCADDGTTMDVKLRGGESQGL